MERGNTEEADRKYQERWNAAVQRYGDERSVPANVIREMDQKHAVDLRTAWGRDPVFAELMPSTRAAMMREQRAAEKAAAEEAAQEEAAV